MDRNRGNHEYARLALEGWDKIYNFEIRQGWNTFMSIYQRSKHGDAWMDYPQPAVWEHALVAFVLMVLALILLFVFAIGAIWDTMELAFSEDGVFREVRMLPGKLIQVLTVVSSFRR